MEKTPESFEEIQKKNVETVKKDFTKAIEAYQPEHAILIMGKNVPINVPIEGQPNEYKFTMNITENICPERLDNFINVLTADATRLKKQKAGKKRFWLPSDN